MSWLLRCAWWGVLACAVVACALPGAGSSRVSTASAAPARQQPPNTPVAAKGPAAETARSAPLVLATAALPDQPGRRFQVQVERCSEPDGCPFTVALLEGERVVARSVLNWARAVSEPAFYPSEPHWGASDPLDPEPLTAAVTGEEATFVATMARPVALGPSVAGLLVDQVGGFEHLRRAHHLLVARGDTLSVAWSHAEASGPNWSSTAVTELEPGRQGVAFFSGTRLAGVEPGEADSLEAELLSWSALDRKLRVSTLNGALHAVVVGPLKSMAKAIALRDQNPACLGAFSILSSATLPAARLKGMLLVQFGVSAAGAERVLKAAQHCAAKTPTRTLMFN